MVYSCKHPLSKRVTYLLEVELYHVLVNVVSLDAKSRVIFQLQQTPETGKQCGGSRNTTGNINHLNITA